MFQYSLGFFSFSSLFLLLFFAVALICLRQFVWCVRGSCVSFWHLAICVFVLRYIRIITQSASTWDAASLSLSLTQIIYVLCSMKWRALICVYSYFAFYFSSWECLCILFSCLARSTLWNADVCFEKITKCEVPLTVYTYTRFFAPAYFVAV